MRIEYSSALNNQGAKAILDKIKKFLSRHEENILDLLDNLPKFSHNTAIARKIPDYSGAVFENDSVVVGDMTFSKKKN